jgi:redox-sensitive bicupin YhaK (pirin superfamily)
MMRVRRAEERGHTQLGWLDSRHTFSFGDYVDPRHEGFRALRVLNDDRVVAGAGFGMHAHRDMEILSFVLDGALEHRDSMGHGSVIRPGEIQFMRAGTGVTHSERNPSADSPVHFLQIWIVPRRTGLVPGYAQQTFDADAARTGWALLAAPDGRAGSIQVEQDVAMSLARIDAGAARAYPLAPGRYAWVHVADGTVRVDGTEMRAGDGAAIHAEPEIALTGGPGAGAAQVLVFDLG